MTLALIFALLATEPTAVPTAKGTTLQPVERRASVVSSDGVLTVENKDTGKGGTMPELVTTVRWKDGSRTFEDDERLGWVESIASFSTPSGMVYVLLAEDKLATTSFALNLFAFRLTDGKLVDAETFLPSLEGGERHFALTIEYSRPRGIDVFPRTLEARVEEAAGRIVVSLFPEAAKGRPRAPGGAKQTQAFALQSFSLVLETDHLAVVDLEDEDKALLSPN